MEVDWPAAVSYLTLTQPSAAANNRLSTPKCANVRVGRWRIIRVIVANTSLFSMFWPFTVIKQATTETLFFQWRPLFFFLSLWKLIIPTAPFQGCGWYSSLSSANRWNTFFSGKNKKCNNQLESSGKASRWWLLALRLMDSCGTIIISSALPSTRLLLSSWLNYG